MIKNQKENANKNVQLLSVTTIIIAIVLMAWIGYSMINFYKIYSNSVENQDDSYIDKQGLEEVKLNIENRQE